MNVNIKRLLVVAFCLSLSMPCISATAADYTWPNELYIGTSGAGSSHHVISSAWGAVMAKDTGSKVRITPEPDPARLMRAIKGDTDMIFMDLGELASYYRGVGAFSDLPKEKFYTVWMEFDPPMGYIVAGDSDLKTLDDIVAKVNAGKRVRVAHFAPAPAWGMRITHMLPAFLDIPKEKLTPVPFGSIRDMYYSVLDGKADIVCGGLTTTILPELMATPKGIRFLDIPDDKEAWKRALEVIPTEWPGQVNDWGNPKDFRGLGCMVAVSLYVATDKSDEDLIYNISKWIHTNFDSYKDAMPQLARMNLKRFREFLDVSAAPVHPGTVKYLKEIGAWTAEDDQWNQEADALMQRYVDAWPKAAAAAKSQKIKIEMGNKKWEALWADTIKDIPPLKTRY